MLRRIDTSPVGFAVFDRVLLTQGPVLAEAGMLMTVTGRAIELHADGVKNADAEGLLHTQAYYTLQLMPAEMPAIPDASRAAR